MEGAFWDGEVHYSSPEAFLKVLASDAILAIPKATTLLSRPGISNYSPTIGQFSP